MNKMSSFQIHNEKLEFKVASRIGSLANVKHRPGGGDKKIFDDKEYIRYTHNMSDSELKKTLSFSQINV